MVRRYIRDGELFSTANAAQIYRSVTWRGQDELLSVILL
jgi:hypothetical protein